MHERNQADRADFLSPLRRWPASGLWRRLTGAALALAMAACTTLPGIPLVRDKDDCHAWTAQLDAAVVAAGVIDAETEPIAGFPGLRVDRVAAALRDEASASEAALAAWLARAAALDRAARAAEIANLPESAFPLGPAANRAMALSRTDTCRDSVVRQLRDPQASGAATTPNAAATTEPGTGLRQALLVRAAVPERYSTASRALGLYPLLRWPFFAGVEGWQNEHLADMARWATSPPPLQRFAPHASEPSRPLQPAGAGQPGAPESSGVPAARAAAVPPSWPPALDALGLPQLTELEARHLLAWFAPAFEVEVRGAFDRFGVPQWSSEGRPLVDARAPVVYQRIAHTRLAGQWLLQLVYTLWFPERPPRSSLDLLAGALDGVIVRLTLGVDGQPILMDTIHACGCYHLFFPSAALQARTGAQRSEEWMFAPAALPALPPTQRLAVRIASATHYVSGVGTAARDEAGAATPGPAAGPAPGEPTYYALRDDHSLHSLPLPGTTPPARRSLYGPDGLVAGTERGERFLFWPMGIASAGAMRQWGHHATAFVGRRHFDEPDLIEQRFRLVPR